MISNYSRFSLVQYWHLADLVYGFLLIFLPYWKSFNEIANLFNLPPLRNLPQLRVLEGIREQVGEGLGQAGVAAFGLGADGVEVHEPRLEERPRHRLQRLVHPPVQLDLVVQRAEDVGDGALFVERWKRELQNVLCCTEA